MAATGRPTLGSIYHRGEIIIAVRSKDIITRFRQYYLGSRTD